MIYCRVHTCNNCVVCALDAAAKQITHAIDQQTQELSGMVAGGKREARYHQATICWLLACIAVQLLTVIIVLGVTAP